MLDSELKKQIDEWVESFEIDVEELESAHYDRNIYDLEPHLAVGGWVWDEDEEYQAQVEKAIDNVDDLELDEETSKEVVEYLESKL